MSSLLEVENITKDFGDGKGVFNLSFSIEPGEIVGFVGPNGAGKSTTIGIACGNIKADKGGVRLFGRQAAVQDVYKYMPDMGVLLSESTIEEQITPRQVFEEAEAMLGMKTSWRVLSDNLHLDTNKTIEKLSLGNKKKVSIVLALMHEPKLVLMDEPTSGIDPIVANKFSKLLRDAAAAGGSVLLSSHDLSELQGVCDRVIMIKSGKLLLNEPIGTLLTESNRKFSINKPSQKLVGLLRQKYGEQLIETSGGLSLQTADYEAAIKLLTKNDFYDFLIENPSLEEMFAEYYL